MKLSKRIRIPLIVLLVMALSLGVQSIVDAYSLNNSAKLQTNVDQAQHLFDGNGVPYLRIEGDGDVYHPAWVGIYALQYAGLEAYDKNHTVLKDMDKFRACVKWLADNLKQNSNGDWVWEYPFDNTYNDVSINTPWISAFGQALGIEALIASNQIDGNVEHLILAQKAADPLFRPVAQGGLLYERDQDIWFEEIPKPADNPSHILNGHMRTLIALKKLADATGEQQYQSWFERGLNTLEKWLPLYDTGYSLRYDLNPKKDELLFRFTNPYGFELTELAVDKVTLRDPRSGEEVSLDVGASVDPEGPVRIAGNDWGQPEVVDNRTVRRLQSVTPATAKEDGDGNLHAPGTYFYLKLPSKWSDNLREGWFELIVEYKDEKPGNVTAQMRSIAPGPAFRDMRDGDLLLTGSGQWRQWRIPLRTTDLGWWVGESYAQKHAIYLNELAEHNPVLKQWAILAKGYLDLLQPFNKGKVKIVNVEKMSLPQQTPMLNYYSLDDKGVLRQHQANKAPVLDPKDQPGTPVYSPYVISEQAANEVIFSRFTFKVKSEPAYNWIAQEAKSINDESLVWEFGFNNVYNDIISTNPWQSAFGQAYVIKALFKAVEENRNLPKFDYKDLLQKAINAYNVPIENGGLSKEIIDGSYFFEEVPNGTHVLNAHLISIETLNNTAAIFDDEANRVVRAKGINALKEKLCQFDTGYWSRYDQNPKKEILLQIDWLSGDQSPAIDEIYLENPQTETATCIDVGSKYDFAAYPHLSGTEWLSAETIDGRTVRQFKNGYQLRKDAVEGGTRHNAFIVAALPKRNFADYFDVPPHRLVIRYKDEAPGEFIIKAQSINEGNSLSFVPLRNGILRCTGDGQWKEATFNLRSQDMGWYMGAFYQKFHMEQLKELSNQTGDWLFKQYAEKWEYFLNAYEQKKDIIVR
ncbi:MAG: hypothetical protein HPY50_07800 [Firmicutes bacterium]|nr:hypothetical protein [Bacillota bacterium]